MKPRPAGPLRQQLSRESHSRPAYQEGSRAPPRRRAFRGSALLGTKRHRSSHLRQHGLQHRRAAHRKRQPIEQMIHDEALQSCQLPSRLGGRLAASRCGSPHGKAGCGPGLEVGVDRFLCGRLSIGREQLAACLVERAARRHHPCRRLPSSSSRLSIDCYFDNG
jgi:hypothetical protein